MRQMISRLNQLSLGVHRVNETMERHDLRNRSEKISDFVNFNLKYFFDGILGFFDKLKLAVLKSESFYGMYRKRNEISISYTSQTCSLQVNVTLGLFRSIKSLHQPVA